MTTETAQNTVKTFKFSFPTCTNEEVLYKLEVPVEIPHEGSSRELVQRVISMFHIPVYLEDELNEKLATFIAEETKNFHNDRDAQLLNQLKNSEINIEGIVKSWEKLFKDNVVEFAEQKGTSDEEVFAAAYHKLVHSPALETILQVESSYAKTVMNMIKNRDDDIQKLTQSQTDEMEEKVRLLNTCSTEEEINALAARHFEQQSLAAGRWDSQLDALRHAQRAAHRTWLMATLDDYQADETLTPSSKGVGARKRRNLEANNLVLRISNAGVTDLEQDKCHGLQCTLIINNSPLCTFPAEFPGPVAAPTPRPRLEESFTIHLGSQLKQTHNIRLVAADMMDLCYVDCGDSDASGRLALYSGELSGVVVLAPAAPERSPLLRAARASTDHHFDDVDRQLRDLVDRLREPTERRNARRAESAGGGSGGRALHTGDVYVTRHSNLAEAHVLFHLVADDDDLKSGDITSRHPAILGLRNILKAACCNDVTSIAIPLLLRQELSEEATAAWCLRRAELVLKCVKGFVLEAHGGGGAELRTLTVLLPPRLAPALFHAVAALPPAIFRVAGPVRARPA